MDSGAALKDKLRRTASSVLSEGRASRQAGRQDVRLRLAHHTDTSGNMDLPDSKSSVLAMRSASQAPMVRDETHSRTLRQKVAAIVHVANAVWRMDSMLYWLGVYSFVVIAVLLPFVLLYLVMVLSWLGLAAIRFAATLRMTSIAKSLFARGTVGARL